MWSERGVQPTDIELLASIVREIGGFVDASFLRHSGGLHNFFTPFLKWNKGINVK